MVCQMCNCEVGIINTGPESTVKKWAGDLYMRMDKKTYGQNVQKSYKDWALKHSSILEGVVYL